MTCRLGLTVETKGLADVPRPCDEGDYKVLKAPCGLIVETFCCEVNHHG